jgi:hypothetical protein
MVMVTCGGLKTAGYLTLVKKAFKVDTAFDVGT